jgi:hypothetical protein
MRLQQTLPDEVTTVPGYEVQTFECIACREIEHRRVFRGELSEAVAVSPLAVLSAAAATSPELPPRNERPRDKVENEVAAATATPVLPAKAREPTGDTDDSAEMLRRAIEMVRSPIRGAPPRGLTDHPQVAPAAPAGAVRGGKPARIVQIRHDPSYEAAYAAKDTRSGLVVLRHQDSTRLRAMCERLGWQVMEES